ncbi:hypothetical protein R1sor_020617 [Riccia sorocarpa]|uniref:Uncharacterized protein n=1 Tax=Riccia sorocarpa TaxID=122646 RepID=A0ABD3GG60_9MARC
MTWVLERSRTAKTWYANDVFLPVWRPIIEIVNVVLLGKQKPLEVTGVFLYILKNKVDLADEDKNLDKATYFKEKIREEIRACKKQMQASGKRKVRPTCIDIVVLHILRTCGIVDDEDIVLSASDKSVEEVTPPRSASAPQVQVLSSSTSPDRVPEPRDIPSSSSPGRTKQASPTSPDRKHSPESSLGEEGAPSTLSDHATRSGSLTSLDREVIVPSDDDSLVGFRSPMMPYLPSDDDEEGAIAGLTPWVHQTPQRYRRVSGPCCTGALLNMKRSYLRGRVKRRRSQG